MAKKRRKKRPPRADLEGQFITYWKKYYPHSLPIREFQFTRQRLWRFDFAWPSKKVALEVQGQGPGHCSLKGMTQDHDKLFGAVARQWTVLYITTTHLSSQRIGGMCEDLAKILEIPVHQPVKMTSYVPRYLRH